MVTKDAHTPLVVCYPLSWRGFRPPSLSVVLGLPFEMHAPPPPPPHPPLAHHSSPRSTHAKNTRTRTKKNTGKGRPPPHTHTLIPSFHFPPIILARRDPNEARPAAPPWPPTTPPSPDVARADPAAFKSADLRPAVP